LYARDSKSQNSEYKVLFQNPKHEQKAVRFLLSAYMKYIRDGIGFTPKILKKFFAQNMFFTDKKS
jgi:hypothetical protein